MLAAVAIGLSAHAADCGARVSVAPILLPQPYTAPGPYGGSLRFDITAVCPPQRGLSTALSVDLGAGAIWVTHTGWFPTLRQQFGLHLEPAARGEVPGGPYVRARLGVTETFVGQRHTFVHPGIVIGYRYEAKSGFTAQFGGGIEVWVPEVLTPVLPIIEMRAGWAFLRP